MLLLVSYKLGALLRYFWDKQMEPVYSHLVGVTVLIIMVVLILMAFLNVIS